MGSGAGILLLVGIAFILVGVSLLYDALALVLFGLSLVICGGYLFKGFRTYIITNKRLVELRAGRIVREVNLNEIVKTYGFSMLGTLLILFLYFLVEVQRVDSYRLCSV